MLWYRPVQEQGLQLPFYSLDIKDVQSGDTRERENHSLLAAGSALPLHHLICDTESMYFCSSSSDTEVQSPNFFTKNLLFPAFCSTSSKRLAASAVNKVLASLSTGEMQGHTDANITQTPNLVLKRGQTAQLTCRQTDNHNSMYWYQQQQGKGLQLIYYSVAVDNKENGDITDGFTVSRPKIDIFDLNISSVKMEHSAVYFCASNEAFFSDTKSDDQLNPEHEGTHSATIVQSPQSVVEELGGQISLECSLEGTSNPYFYWYRQLPGGQIHMFAYSVSTGQVDNTGPSHFSTSRIKDKEFLLSINGLLANDTGVYYCAWSHTLSQVCAAPGQKLPLLPRHEPAVCPPPVVQQAAAACEERE
ncbi:hypothetical protein KIL84_020376 [Mauremys mutica]|uniref:Ig-like domain-containing protein n=1 Tax=Mauremys mutica TaxID=74926 RepID=A0A9D3XX28_9SAUR|nr:hypothetical protein KIL84_020376 [Mauremys mutica]